MLPRRDFLCLDRHCFFSRQTAPLRLFHFCGISEENNYDVQSIASCFCFQMLKVMLSLARTPMIETAMVLKIH